MYEGDFDEDYRTEDIYRLKKPEREPRPVFQRVDEDLKREIEKKVLVKARVAAPQFEPQPREPLKRLGPKVIGSLFDRIDFLRERIQETVDATATRKKLHQQMIKEIDEDIKEKMEIESHLTDFDEKRNFKLDISQLRKEKRQESVLFWKDVLELQTELKELSQEYTMEKKIADIFKNLKGGYDAGD